MSKKLNIKAYWVVLGPNFRRIKEYFYFSKKRSSKEEEFEKEMFLVDLEHLEDLVLIFDSFTKSERDRLNLQKIKDFIKITREHFENLEFSKKMELRTPISIKHFESTEVVLKLSKVG